LYSTLKLCAYLHSHWLKLKLQAVITESGNTLFIALLTADSTSTSVIFCDHIISIIITIFNYALQPLRLIVRSSLDIPTFATRRLHAYHHARAPSAGKLNCWWEMSGNFA
jgi:hypothetical protein